MRLRNQEKYSKIWMIFPHHSQITVGLFMYFEEEKLSRPPLELEGVCTQTTS